MFIISVNNNTIHNLKRVINNNNIKIEKIVLLNTCLGNKTKIDFKNKRSYTN